MYFLFLFFFFSHVWYRNERNERDMLISYIVHTSFIIANEFVYLTKRMNVKSLETFLLISNAQLFLSKEKITNDWFSSQRLETETLTTKIGNAPRTSPTPGPLRKLIRARQVRKISSNHIAGSRELNYPVIIRQSTFWVFTKMNVKDKSFGIYLL